MADYQTLVGQAAGRGLPDDWLALGGALMEGGFWGSAAGCFARVVAAEPENFVAWANWGWCGHQMGRNEVASDRLRRAVELAPGEGRTCGLLGHTSIGLR